MTNQRRLFIRNLIPIRRRWIKVGGGRLFSDFKGDVALKCPDGSSGILPDFLLVNGLGVNLLSAKKFCEKNNAKGVFDDKIMIFRNKNNKIILSASLIDGPYKVDHIAGLSERALCSRAFISASEDIMQMKIDFIPKKESDNIMDDGKPIYSRAEIIEKRRNERYWLYHRRCGHASPRIISLLHTVIDIDRPVKVPPNLDLCDVCLATKMKKFRHKTLAPHKNEKLVPISVNIAGPFPESLDGRKYFAEIIDNCTRQKWILFLKAKSDIIEALNEWGNVVERQSGFLILAVRSDNASEILKVLKNWRQNNGAVAQSTAPYSSHQNGTAERAIQSTVYATRAMLKEAKLPVEFWTETAKTHIYISNRIKAGPVLSKVEDG